MALNRQETFTRVYDECVWHVYGFLGYHVRTREEAEDLTQLTFERALRAWSRYDPDRASPRTWLLAIARNLLIDHYRRDRSAEHEPMPDDGDPTPAWAEQRDGPRLGLSPELEVALEQLSDRDREVIALRFGGDLTGPEIADATGLSVANVQQILSRSLRRLRAALEPVGSSENVG